MASVFNYRNDANGELYNEVKHNIDNVGIFNVDMKKPDSYFINRLPSNASGAIYNHRRYDGYGNDAASFYDPVENIVINDVSKQKDKRFDNGDYYDRAIPHELGHTMDPYFDLSHAQYFSKDIFGHKYIDDGVSFDNNRHSYQQLYDAHKSNPFINFEHENYAHENYADIHALRYNLYRFGIKDIANGDVITKSDLSKYKKIISKLPVGPRNAFSRIFSVFDDAVIVNMLNKRASNNTNKQSIVKKNVFAEGGHIFKNGGTGLPSYPYLSVPQRQWSYSTPHVDYAGRISSFNPYNTGLVDPETGAYQLKPVVIKAKPEPMAARISANAKEEKKAAEQARLEAEEVARVKKNHPMADSDYDKSSIFNQPTQHPYLYSIAHEGGYSPSQTWQSAKEGMAAALAAPAAIAGAGAIGAAGGIGNVLNAPTIIGGRIASAAGLPAYYGSTAVDAAFAAHGANTLKDLAVKKYNGQSLDANDYANAALAGLEMAPAAPAIVNGMKMIKVPRYLSTDPEYALAAQTPSGQTMYIKPNEYRMLDEAKPGNEAPPEGDGTLASTLKKVKGKTSGLFKREKDPDDDMLRPESSMLGHYLKKTAGGLANAYGKLTDFTPTRLPYINAKRVINTNMNTYLDNDRYYLKEIQNNTVDLSNASLFDKMTYEDAQKMYNAGVRWDDTKGTYDIAKTASDASEQSATPEVSPDVAKKYADLLNHRFDFSLKQVSSGDSKSNFMEGFKPGVGKAGQWNPQKKYANPNDDYESFMRSYLPGYRKFISIEDPYTHKPLLSAGKVMLSDHPIDQFMWKHPYLTRLPIGLVAGTAVNGLNNRITNGGWFNTDPNQFETPGVFADKSNASNRVRQITELASVLGPNWIRGIGYPLIAATGIYDKVAPTPFSINQPSIYKTFDNWNVRHNEDQSYPEKNYFQYLDSAKAHNFQEPYTLTLLNDSTPMVNPQIIDQNEEMNAYKYTGTEKDSTAQDTLNQ